VVLVVLEVIISQLPLQEFEVEVEEVALEVSLKIKNKENFILKK
jgi:hypothetical protein